MKVLMILVVFALTGCAGSSRYMVLDKTPDSHRPPADKSMVIFVRTSGLGFQLNFTVIDGNGRFIGQVPAKGHVKHVTAPGHHRFIVWAENTEAMDAQLVAGRTYYVEVVPGMGRWTVRSDLFPIKRGSENWDEAVQRVNKTGEWDRDHGLAAQWKEVKSEGIERQLDRARKSWESYSAEEKVRRTAAADDGR